MLALYASLTLFLFFFFPMKIFSKAKLIRYVLRNEGVPVEFHFLAVGKVDKVKNYFFFQKGEKKISWRRRTQESIISKASLCLK